MAKQTLRKGSAAIKIYGPYKSKNAKQGTWSYHIEVPSRPKMYIFSSKQNVYKFLDQLL